MAQNSNNEELRRQALATLIQGRAEIRAEMDHLRNQLSPVQLMHRVVDRHASLLVSFAFLGGLIPAVFLFQSKHSLGKARPPATVSVTKAPPKPMPGAVLMGTLGVLAKTTIPALIKSAILPRVLESLSGRAAVASQDQRSTSHHK